MDPGQRVGDQGNFTYMFNTQHNLNRQVNTEYSQYPGEVQTLSTGSRFQDKLYEKTMMHNYYQANVYATYAHTWNEKHNFKAMAGFNWETKYLKDVSATGYNLLSETLMDLNLVGQDADGNERMEVGGGQNEYALMGFFGRLNYDYKGKYLVEVSGRYDGNSKFPSNQRWGFFPSASVGWRISEEPFMAGAKSWLDNLKIRASFGSTGNGQVDNYLFLSKIAIKKNLGFLTGDSPLIYADKPSLIPDGLTWETVSTYDLGLDWEMLNGRLSIVADIYRKNTTDMYVVGPATSRPYFGNSAPKGNYADMRTDGWEASLSWRDSHKVAGKTLSYNIKVAVWDNTSKITRYTAKTGTLPTNYSINYYEGMTLGEMWGYKCDGLFQSDEEAQTWANYSKFTNRSATWQAGDPRYLDLNGDGYVNNGNNTIYDHGDLVKIGNTTPRYSYSIQGGVRWNGIGISMMWQGVGKRDWYPAKESGLFLGTSYGPPSTGMALRRHHEATAGHRPTAAPTGRAWSAIRPATRA